MIFEKIRKRLQETRNQLENSCLEVRSKEDCGKYIECGVCIMEAAIDIVNQVEAEYNNGWISVDDRLPETNDAVNVVWVNRKPEPYYASIKDKPFTATGHYHNGKWYWFSSVCKDYLDEYGNSSIDEVDEYIDIIAWQPLPQPPKEE